MFKYHKIIAVCIGVLFLIVVQTFSEPHPIFRFLVPAFLGFCIVVSGYNYFYLKSIQKYNLWVFIRPIFLFFGCFGLSSFIPSDVLRGVYLLGSVAVIAFVEYFLGNFAENIQLNETLLIAFAAFISLTAADQYAPGYHIWYIIGTFIITVAITRGFYEIIPKPNITKLLFAVALGLFMSELFLVLSYLPQHYSATALILFNVFYFCLILNYYFFYNTLTIKKIQYHFALMSVCSILVFVVTPWKIVT